MECNIYVQYCLFSKSYIGLSANENGVYYRSSVSTCALPELDPSAKVQIIHLLDERAPSTIRTRRGAVLDSVRGDGGVRVLCYYYVIRLFGYSLFGCLVHDH